MNFKFTVIYDSKLISPNIYENLRNNTIRDLQTETSIARRESPYNFSKEEDLHRSNPIPQVEVCRLLKLHKP